jgi:hypothetical protein
MVALLAHEKNPADINRVYIFNETIKTRKTQCYFS